jgi:transcriptional regulator with XRE-family HTH domain
LTGIRIGYIFVSVKCKTLQEYFERTGTTQVELAKRLRISQAHLSQIMNGLRSPSLELAVLIEDETGVPMRSLAREATAS